MRMVDQGLGFTAERERLRQREAVSVSRPKPQPKDGDLHRLTLSAKRQARLSSTLFRLVEMYNKALCGAE